MDQQQGQVNRSIKDLNMKLGDLGNIIRRKGSALKMKQVTTIIPSRESEGEVTVSIETVKSTAQDLANKFQYDMPPAAQKDVNDLYDGLVKAIDVGNQSGGGRRRGTKRRGTKRRGTKRRRSSRK